jgi:hypothetical protein
MRGCGATGVRIFWVPSHAERKNSWQLAEFAGDAGTEKRPAEGACVTSYWDHASRSLPEDDQRRLAEIAERLRLAGAADPRSWALSEVSEDIAQLTRFLFLRGVWRRMRSCADAALASPLADELRRAGASEDHLREFTQKALGDLAFSLLYFIDEPDGTSWDTPPEHDVADGDRRWLLAEAEPDGRPTGRDVGGLHESLSDTDPGGHEGAGWTT